MLWFNRKLDNHIDEDKKAHKDVNERMNKATEDCTAIRLRQSQKNSEFVTYDKMNSIIELHTNPIKSDVSEIKSDIKQLLRNGKDSK